MLPVSHPYGVKPGMPMPVSPASMRSGLEPNSSPRPSQLATPLDAQESDGNRLDQSLASVASSTASKGQAERSSGDRSSAGSLQVRKIQMMVEQELAMSTSALHEQFRQQLEIERSDRQAALADIRRDISSMQTSLSKVQSTSEVQSTAPAPSYGSDAALLDMRGQVASLRDDMRGALARQDSFVGDFESLRRDLDAIQSSVADLRTQTASVASEPMGALEQQRLSTAQLREDVLALAQRLVVVEQGAAEAASAAAAAAMTRVDTSQFLTAVRLEIAQPLEAEIKRDIESVRKQALDRIDDVASNFESDNRQHRSSTEELRAMIKAEQAKAKDEQPKDKEKEEKVRLEDLQSALEAEHEARRAAVDELRACITEQWGAAARSAQTSNETSGRLRELADEINAERKMREATIDDLQKQFLKSGQDSIKSVDLEKMVAGATGPAATNARIDELARSLENEQQVRTAEVEDLLSRIMHLSAKSVANANQQLQAPAAAAAAGPEGLSTLASNAEAAASRVDSIRLRNEVLEELRVEFGGRVRAQIAEQSADLRAELVARIEAIESHLWRAKVDEDLRQKFEDVLRLTRTVIGQAEKLQERVVHETAARKAGETKISARVDRLERNVIEKGMQKQLIEKGVPPQQDFSAVSVSSAGHATAATPTTGTVISEEEPLEDVANADPAAGFISSALRSTLEELVDKVQKTLRPGSVEPPDHVSTEATPSESSQYVNATGDGPSAADALARSVRNQTPTNTFDRGDRSSSRGPGATTMYSQVAARAGSQELRRNRSPLSNTRSIQEGVAMDPHSPRPESREFPLPEGGGGSMHRIASRENPFQDNVQRMLSSVSNIREDEGAAQGHDRQVYTPQTEQGASFAANLASNLASANFGGGSLKMPAKGVDMPNSAATGAPGGSFQLPMKPHNVSPSPRTSSAARGPPGARTASLDISGRNNSVEAARNSSVNARTGMGGLRQQSAAGPQSPAPRSSSQAVGSSVPGGSLSTSLPTGNSASQLRSPSYPGQQTLPSRPTNPSPAPLSQTTPGATGAVPRASSGQPGQALNPQVSPQGAARAKPYAGVLTQQRR